MIILAHRGLWFHPEERNTRAAFQLAFERGFGVELDVRDHDGELVISHDMPTGEQLTFRQVLEDYQATGLPAWIAINVKADGLAGAIERELGQVAGAAERSFVFDMAVPDMLGYLGRSMMVFTRHSDIEPYPPIEDRTDGTWMDCFGIPWADPIDVVTRLRAGRRVAIVSPELHKRDNYLQYWSLLRDAIKNADLSCDVVKTKLALCTDFGDAAASFFWNK